MGTNQLPSNILAVELNFKKLRTVTSLKDLSQLLDFLASGLLGFLRLLDFFDFYDFYDFYSATSSILKHIQQATIE